MRDGKSSNFPFPNFEYQDPFFASNLNSRIAKQNIKNCSQAKESETILEYLDFLSDNFWGFVWRNGAKKQEEEEEPKMSKLKTVSDFECT